MKDKIVIKGARAHNLKNVDLTIPRDQLQGSFWGRWKSRM